MFALASAACGRDEPASSSPAGAPAPTRTAPATAPTAAPAPASPADAEAARAAVARGRLLFAARDFAGARAAFAEAMQRDPASADALFWAGRADIASSAGMSYSRAIEYFERALALEPGNASIAGRYSVLLMIVGRRTEALATARKGTELDPLSVESWLSLANVYLSDRSSVAEARGPIDRAFALNPESTFVKSSLVTLALLQGDGAQALAVARTAGPAWSQILTAMAEHTLGHAQESQAALDEVVAKYAHEAAYQIAGIYAWRGEKDKAFEWLDRAYAQADGGMAYIKTDLFLESIRSDPRFAAMVKKMGLPA
ncbi:MAG TPA: tetratricopeptide repeat protein [Planctomycetota bacterium]|nr:tetratricopeptide repeat protein [Planctomycetota bacterium]